MARGRGRGGKRGGGRGGRGGGNGTWSQDRSGTNTPNQGSGNEKSREWNEMTRENRWFEEYYKAENIIGTDEWSDFMATLKRDLPTTFRVTGSRAHADSLNEIIKSKYLPELQRVHELGLVAPGGEREAVAVCEKPVAGDDAEGAEASSSETPVAAVEENIIKPEPPKQMSWYPGGLGWQIDAPKRLLRKSEEYRSFQRFLVGETEIGNISRQEAVSMIPPLLLNIESHHHCLDMCAAPGSKTAQMLEALNHHASISTGLLIANDSDAKRCHMLVHQTGRMPSVGLGVTNNDASLFPNIFIDGKSTPLLFDRILADVPCTGDGTFRKNVDIWNSWTVANGNMLHGLQLRILLRAMQLLKPGGRMVYSTCSFNPVENEAVVAAALDLNKGKFRLVPTPKETVLPQLKRRDGLSSWKVAVQDNEKNIIWLDSYLFYQGYMAGSREKYRQVTTDEELATKSEDWKTGYEEGKSGTGSFKEKPLAPTLWAPEGAEHMGLEHCLRLAPHDQNTGGFFVCVLEREEGESKITGPHAAVQNAREAAATETVKTESGSIEVDISGEQSVKRARSPSPSAEDSSKKAKVEEATVEPVAAAEASTSTSTSTASKTADGAATPILPLTEKQLKRKEHQNGGFKEDPFFFLKPDDPEMDACIKYFEFSPDFPRDRLFVRNQTGEANRIVYMANPILKTMIDNNEYSRIRLLSAGIRILVKQDTSGKNDQIACRWRIPATGLDALLPYMDKSKIIVATMADLRVFLMDQYPFMAKFGESFQKKMEDKVQGCHVVTFPAGDHDGGHLSLPLTMPIWKATNSVSLMIDKKEKSTLSLRTFGEDLTLHAQPIQGKRAEEAAAAAATPAPVAGLTEEEMMANAE